MFVLHGWIFVLAAPLVAASLLLLVLVSRLQHLRQDLWLNLHVVGLGSNTSRVLTRHLQWLRAIVASLTSYASAADDGYCHFSKAQGIPFALPTMWTGGAVVVLPQAMLKLLNRPDSELAAVPAQLSSIQLPYMFSDPDIYENLFHFDTVRKALSPKKLDLLAFEAADEIARAFEHYWDSRDSKAPSAGQARILDNWDACGNVVTRVAFRNLVGAFLCRNDELVDIMQKHASLVMSGTAFINCLPPMVRPILGPLFGLRPKSYQRRCLAIMRPYIDQVARNLNEDRPEAYPPADFLRELLQRCAKEGPIQLDSRKIALRILAMSTMSIMGLAYVLSHCVLDLFGSPSSERFVRDLQRECRVAAQRFDGISSQEATASLHCVQSALRESMRYSDINATNLSRDVAVDELDLGNGIKIPRGVRVTFPTQGIQHDPAIYKDPWIYDAFRFVPKLKSHSKSGGTHSHDMSTETDADTKAARAVNQASSFLVFGYGRHICPGRAYSEQVLKQTMAYILLNYDVQVIDERPRRQAIQNMMMPAIGMRIKVRRTRGQY